MQTITPTCISYQVLQLAHKLVPNSKPIFIPIQANPNAKLLECFQVTKGFVSKNSGEVVYGWRVWERPTVMLEAEFHAVWRSKEGQLTDVSYSNESGKTILFLIDPQRVYEGKQVNNYRQPRRQGKAIEQFINACNVEFNLKNRGKRAYENGEIKFTNSEIDEWNSIQDIKAKIDPLLRVPIKLKRNEPCHCGSERKFKKCCKL